MTKQAKNMKILVQKNPDDFALKQQGIFDWPIWEKEISTFPWTYDDAETCYFLEGAVVVTPQGGASVSIGKSDLVTFPAGMSCTWDIQSPVKKHYKFG